MGRQRTHILLVEDEPAHAELIRRAFRTSPGRFRLETAGSLGEARACLAQTTPDLVITDLRLPDGEGTELLSSGAGDQPYPLVVMTSQGDERAAVESMKAGALDYVVKSADTLAETPRTAERALREWDHITERKRAEEALQRSESTNRAILDAIPDMIFRLSRDGAYLDFIPGTGVEPVVPRDEFLGRRVHEVLPPEIAEEITLRVEMALQTGETQLYEHQVVVSGERRDWETRFAVSGDDEVLAIVRDVTTRRRLEGQLRQAQKMETVGRLAGGVAHDFNNLLTAVLGYSQLGEMRLPPDESLARTCFEEIRKAAERAADLTRQLLAFSRRRFVEPTAFSLSDMVIDIDGMLRRLISEDIELVTLPALDLGIVEADVGEIEQVLTNLAVNAKDAMPNGGKLIVETANVTIDAAYVAQHPEASVGDYVMLSVSDNGAGMTEEVKSSIFEPFFTTKEVGKGTGLGLSTCYGIVTQAGGHITVESEPGKGATFRACLPRVAKAGGQLRQKASRWERRPSGDHRVLLVEDEPSVRAMASTVLREEGYDVLEATNGSEALRMAEQHASGEIHLLLTDLVMPLMGGQELAERFRVLYPETRVLFSSGYPEGAPIDASARGAGIDFLAKPFTPAILTSKVKGLLDGHGHPDYVSA